MDQYSVVIPNQSKISIKSLNGDIPSELLQSAISLKPLNYKESVLSIQSSDPIIAKVVRPGSIPGSSEFVSAQTLVITIRASVTVRVLGLELTIEAEVSITIPG